MLVSTEHEVRGWKLEDSFQVRACLFFVAYLNRRCDVRPQALGSLALNRRCGVRPQASGRLASGGSSCVCNRHLVEPLEPSGRLAQARRSYLPTGHRYWWFMCGDRPLCEDFRRELYHFGTVERSVFFIGRLNATPSALRGPYST